MMVEPISHYGQSLLVTPKTHTILGKTQHGCDERVREAYGEATISKMPVQDAVDDREGVRDTEGR